MYVHDATGIIPLETRREKRTSKIKEPRKRERNFFFPVSSGYIITYIHADMHSCSLLAHQTLCGTVYYMCITETSLIKLVPSNQAGLIIFLEGTCVFVCVNAAMCL